MKLVIAGGGTGGHLYPGIAVAERVSELGIDVLFMVSGRGIEKEVLSKLGYKFVEQDVTAFKGEGLGGKLKALLKLKKAANEASGYIDRGDKILLMGGFAAAPVAVAASMKKADIHIHEQNSVMGLVNRMMSTQAKRIFLSYKPTLKAPDRSIFTGNPVRKELREGDIKAEMQKKILVLGGSGGSRKINTVVASCAKVLIEKGYTIRHQTGKKLYDETVEAYDKMALHDSVELTSYIDDMAEAYREADIVVARAGSGTIFEVTYAKRPAIYIPFAKAANNHQFFNAKVMKDHGYAELFEEKDLTPESLIEMIESMLTDVSKYNKPLSFVEPLDSADLIVRGMGLKRL